MLTVYKYHLGLGPVRLLGRINWFGAVDRLLSQEYKTREMLRKINSHQQKETGTGFDRGFVLLEFVAERQRYPPNEEEVPVPGFIHTQHLR